MITEKKGNILDADEEVLVNPVNCMGYMGAGLSKQFAEKFPEMLEDYKKECNKNIIGIGQPQLWESDNVKILNLPTKNHFANKSKIEYIEKGLNWILDNYKQKEISELALPKIGTGLGGLGWNEVKTIIFNKFQALEDLHVVIYHFDNEDGE